MSSDFRIILYVQRYNSALKEAISLWTMTKETRRKKMNNPKHFGIDKTISQILKEVNFKYLSEDTKKITKGTLLRYYDNQWQEKVPKGPAPMLPDEFMNMIRLHIKVMQLSKKAQPSGNLIQQLISSSVVGTQYENCSARAAWNRVRRMFPTEIKPCTVSKVDSLRNEWTTYTKVNDWFSSNKITLIQSGLAHDVPSVLPDGTFAELTIGSVEADRIVNFDETDHPLSTEFDRGGNRALRWGDPRLPQGSQKGTRSNTHTTRIYGSTANGTPMPPVFIFDTKAKDEKNF